MVNQVDFRASESVPRSRAQPSPTAGQGAAFASVLQGELARGESVRFSVHARERLERRQIALTGADLARVDGALDVAAAKGARDSLFLMDELALVVNVPNRTVITVFPTNEVAHSVFTNIDSAVVVPPATASPVPMETQGPDPAWGGLDAAE